MFLCAGPLRYFPLSMGLSFCDPWQAETFLNLFDNIPAKVLKSRIRTEMTDEYWKEVMELGKILAWEMLQINNIRVYWLPFRLVIKCRSASYVCLTVTLPPTSWPTPQHLSGSFLIKLKLYRRESTKILCSPVSSLSAYHFKNTKEYASDQSRIYRWLTSRKWIVAK